MFSSTSWVARARRTTRPWGGRNPKAQILCVSYAQELADKLSRDCRRIVASDWYRRLFPTRLSAQRQAVPEFETTA